MNNDHREVEVTEKDTSLAVLEMLGNLAQRIVALEKQAEESTQRIAILEHEVDRMESRESVNTLARDLAELIAKEARKNGRG